MTNVLNYVGHELVGPLAISGERGKWMKRHLGTRSLTTLLGRTNVAVAWAFLAYDAVSIGLCVANN